MSELKTAFEIFEEERKRQEEEMRKIKQRIEGKTVVASLTPHTTNLIIAHEKIKNFETGEVAPRVNKIVLRNVDIVLRMSIENGKRTIKVFEERKLPTKVEWYFGE